MKKSLFLALPLLLSACLEDAAYTHIVGHSSHDSVDSFMVSATSRGPLLVGVFGDQARALGPAIRQGMESGMHRRTITTTRDINSAADPHYRVIWMTNPPQSYNPHNLCKGRLPQSAPRDKPTFLAAFCIGDDLARDVSGTLNPDITLPSETFRKFVGTVTRALFK